MTVSAIPAPPRQPSRWLTAGPAAPFMSAWRYRSLLNQLVRRDIEQRFRGTLLGRVWAVIVPLVMLAIYTFVFGVVMKPQWQGAPQSSFGIALTYFSGLILFDFFIDCFNRAPVLMIEHVTYIKKLVFPLEVMAWVVVGSALFRLLVSATLLLVFYLAIDGMPPPQAVMALVVVAPLGLFVLGFVWFLSATGVYLRDVRQIIGVTTPVVMFLSPIFFPITAVPEQFRPIFFLNPMTFALESVRGALFAGRFDHWGGLALYSAVGWLFAWAGYRFFMRLRPGFADVL